MASNDTRHHIIETGADLIGQKGFGATGINAVLTAAGVPKGSFYHYFSSKNDFGLAVIDSFAEEYDATLDRILNDSSRSCVDRLRAYFDTGFETMTSCEYTRGCLIGNLGQELAGQSEAFRTRLDKVFSGWEKRFERCIAEAQTAGDIDAHVDPADAASFLLSGWEGAILRSKVLKSTEPMERFVRVFFKQCLGIN
ncbi:TetR family transcriptional regulator C-terminal domain-containing protein [Marinobacter koreensis]|jgi:TetR/AcrR family transcriptional repressor of nem operon|uniref:TetR family transcriptional regulator C-terminal domain-containing protein n=1 Tax=Marinobacter koreensis TaxID=335974 RepID=A0ABW0RPA7_9GAMM|nr:TetR/AcrR family transcriptional regulator [Marinobacter koreensis]MCK7548869.1 TetR/AcrR family transcriptional regulator [Marinobacter koreensis]MDX1818054.1 TetR family transcriptional regulator C-terminal domain-containing protein [Marinobacter sp.]